MSPRDFKQEPRLPRFSLDRRVTVLVLALTTVVVGVVALMGIPAELFPRGFNDPFLSVTVPWQDAPPREVMDKIAVPLEEEFGTIRGLHRMTSVSFTGNARVFMWFKQGTDMDIAYREVRDRIERARVQFPSDVDRTFINKEDVSGFPIYMVGIAVDPDIQNPWELIQYEVIQRVERIDGVASINYFGLEEKEILIEVDRERANAAGINIFQLAQDLGDDNFTMASGTVKSGARKLLLRSVASYDSIEQIENRMLAPSVRLKDVATVTYDEPDKEYRARINSHPAVALNVLKESEANTREVSKRIDAVIVELNANPRLAGLDLQGFFSQGDIIDEQLSTLGRSGMIGGMIAVAVLFIFMRRFRLTIIVAASIPFSMVIGVTVMYFAGETLNILSLIGLMICIGLLVDNSVVVAENIHRLHREGAARRDACIRGAGEVALAITMSTLTTIVVFMPAALVQGPAQFFLLRLAIPVAVSVAASLFVALVFIPVCVYLTLPSTIAAGAPTAWQRTHQRMNGVLRRGYDLTFGNLNDLYNKVLGWSLLRRFDTVLAILAIFAFTMAATQGVKSVGQQEDEQAQFRFEISMPRGTTLEEAADWFNGAEKVFEANKDELGLDGWFIFHRQRFGEMQAWFDPDRGSALSAKEGQKVILDALDIRPGMEVFTGNDREANEKNKGIYTVFVKGEDIDILDDVVEDLEDLFQRVDGVLGLKKSTNDAPNELGLIVDREKAQNLGVNPRIVAGVVSYALRGQALPDYYDEGREVPVRIRFREEDRESLTELFNFQVPVGDGTLPVSALTERKFLDSPRVIVRRDKAVGRSITLELIPGEEEETKERLALLQANINLPEGVTFGSNRALQQANDDLDGLKFAVLLSIVFIYLLMGFLFESMILPLSILLTIPLSLIGVRWIHLITGRDIDFLGWVAMILLVGVVVNNGIVLIDYINRLRNEGRSRRDAVLQATHLRFRPIMMTAITTIGGMVPLATAGASSIGLSYTSFSLTLIGGMTTGTLLTLLVIPVFYTLFDDARQKTTAAVVKALGLGGPAASLEPSAAGAGSPPGPSAPER